MPSSNAVSAHLPDLTTFSISNHVFYLNPAGLTNDALALVEYALNLVSRGCLLDLTGEAHGVRATHADSVLRICLRV